jgi:hypothetical protein
MKFRAGRKRLSGSIFHQNDKQEVMQLNVIFQEVIFSTFHRKHIQRFFLAP